MVTSVSRPPMRGLTPGVRAATTAGKVESIPSEPDSLSRELRLEFGSKLMGEHIVDITIIGGGPTGLAAAYYGAHRDASVRIVESLEQLGGQVAAVYPEKHIFDVAGYPKVNGQELIDRLTEQALQYEPEVRLGEVIESIEHRSDDAIELH